MLIYAGVLSDNRSVGFDEIKEIDKYGIDGYHIDFTDHVDALNYISKLREFSCKPVDIHIINYNPSKYYDAINDLDIQNITIQYELVKGELFLPNVINNSKIGLAFTVKTNILDILPYYIEKIDYITFMSTTPAKCGLKFDEKCYEVITRIMNQYPNLTVNIDGGVEPSVLESLSNNNVSINICVSGSYLFTQSNIEKKLQELKNAYYR